MGPVTWSRELKSQSVAVSDDGSLIRKSGSQWVHAQSSSPFSEGRKSWYVNLSSDLCNAFGIAVHYLRLVNLCRLIKVEELSGRLFIGVTSPSAERDVNDLVYQTGACVGIWSDGTYREPLVGRGSELPLRFLQRADLMMPRMADQDHRMFGSGDTVLVTVNCDSDRTFRLQCSQSGLDFSASLWQHDPNADERGRLVINALGGEFVLQAC